MAMYVGVDFGARCIEISQKDKGIILREPNVAAVDAKGNVVAVGSQALLVRTRVPGAVTIRKPLVSGVITDFNLCAEILDRCLEIAVPGAKKHVIAAVKHTLAGRERDALVSALNDCRVGKITIVEAPIAALMGAGYESTPAEKETFGGSIVCDIGAQSIEAAYIRAGEILRTEVSMNAGDAADFGICKYIAGKYGISVTPAAAREAKHKLSLYADESEELVLNGIDGTTAMPRKVTVNSTELLQPCAAQIEGAVEVLEKLLKNLPRNGESESVAERIIIFGGGALMPGIDEYIAQRIEREVIVANEPLDCVSRGLCRLLEKEGR